MIENNNYAKNLILASKNIVSAKEKVKKAALDFLHTTKEIETLNLEISDLNIQKRLQVIIASLYESISFEDIVFQHLQNALSLIDNKNINKENDLLNGPAVSKDEGLSQDDIDKMMNDK